MIARAEGETIITSYVELMIPVPVLGQGDMLVSYLL